MAYSAITTPEVAVDAPVSNPLWTKVKNNFDYLKALEVRLPKCFGTTITPTGLQANSFNTGTITNDSSGVYTVNFTSALASAVFTVTGSAATASGQALIISFPTGQYTTGHFKAYVQQSDGTFIDPAEFSFVVHQNL